MFAKILQNVCKHFRKSLQRMFLGRYLQQHDFRHVIPPRVRDRDGRERRGVHHNLVRRVERWHGIRAYLRADAPLRLCPIASHSVCEVLLRMVHGRSVGHGLHIRAVGIQQQAVAVGEVVVRCKNAVSVPLALRLVVVRCLVFLGLASACNQFTGS